MTNLQKGLWSILLYFLLFCNSADALASTKMEFSTRESKNAMAEFNIQQLQLPFINMKCETISSMQTSRRGAIASATILASTLFVTNSSPVRAEGISDLDSYLYKIIRVREATQQEKRLIETGKFKDTQRANVKLAVKFMVQNYRLSDSIVGASSFLRGSSSMRAIEAGQMAVANLQTILEYFDTSDIENIKVGKSSMNGKEDLVIKGLDATQVKLDEFLLFFDEATLKKIKAQVQEENELNIKEFDESLGVIINLPPPS